MKDNKMIQDLEMLPHPSIKEEKFNEQYSKNKETWDKVFSFVKNTDLNQLEVGKYTIDENCIAIISEYETKNVEDGKIESHLNNIDLQYVISGEEYMGLVPEEKATVTVPYNEVKDVIFYESDAIEFHVADSTSFFLFFPGDIHQPSIDINGEKRQVKKLVAKIPNKA